jgi:hypothetical protein
MKFGRKPRAHNARIPHMKAVRAGAAATWYPPFIDYAAAMPASLGEMLNDSLGDCTCAAVGHAIQVWSFNTSGALSTPSDTAILALYEATSGYIPGDPATDTGAVEQDVLGYWLDHAIEGSQLSAFIELDPTDLEDVKRSVFECGLVYIGFVVPAYLADKLMTPGSLWDLDPAADNSSVGGHAVDVVGYDAAGNLTVISWGSRYTMTARFFAQFVDEAYALANKTWIKVTGNSPAGLTLEALESLMATMQFTPPSGDRRQHRRRKRRRAAATA